MDISEQSNDNPSTPKATGCKYQTLTNPSTESLSLFLPETFRDYLCRCNDCYALLCKHPQLIEEEDTYEPPRSEGDDDGPGGGSVGSRSLLDRGEAALSNMDRVRAIEGVMVYNHLKDKVKNFLKPFAESGQPVGAEDIKKYFEKLRGDEAGVQSAGKAGENAGNGAEEDSRREQGGKFQFLNNVRWMTLTWCRILMSCPLYSSYELSHTKLRPMIRITLDPLHDVVCPTLVDFPLPSGSFLYSNYLVFHAFAWFARPNHLTPYSFLAPFPRSH